MAALNSCRFVHLLPVSSLLFASDLPALSASAAETKALIKTLDTAREFPNISSRAEWEARAREIREHILVSCGLWPMPVKTPLQAHLFGRIERDGYSVEKVYFQTYPGFYLGGNLYRPLGHGSGPFPGILNPHGHWSNGRMADTKEGSIPARCINFARLGMVAFSYDMVGFNDTHFADTPTNRPYYQVHRQFGAEAADELWNISLMGLQTWDSIRALDFLESLPDVDRKRLACTGESGGGTQTFMLGAIDERLAAQAPVVMVSHIMQGGCSCENAPGLRVEYSNMEFAAGPAARPQILVAATGDWTRMTLEVEGPAIAHIYELFDARDKFDFVRFDFGHNYNQTSREAVYGWFGRWLLPEAKPSLFRETSCQKESDADLRVFPDGQLPDNALTREQFTESLRKLHQAQWQALVPGDKGGLAKYQEEMRPLWRHSLVLEPEARRPGFVEVGSKEIGQFFRANYVLDRHESGSALEVAVWNKGNGRKDRAKVVVLAQPDGGATGPEERPPAGLALNLLEHGFGVMEVTHYSGFEASNQFTNFYTTYNRTRVQQRVRDLTAVCRLGRAENSKVILVGAGKSGPWALLASPEADGVIADAQGLDVSSDKALLSPDLFFPGVRNLGGFEGAALLAAPHPLLLDQVGQALPTAALRSGYKAAGAIKQLKIEPGGVPQDRVVKWIEDL